MHTPRLPCLIRIRSGYLWYKCKTGKTMELTRNLHVLSSWLSVVRSGQTPMFSTSSLHTNTQAHRDRAFRWPDLLTNPLAIVDGEVHLTYQRPVNRIHSLFALKGCEPYLFDIANALAEILGQRADRVQVISIINRSYGCVAFMLTIRLELSKSGLVKFLTTSRGS